MKVIYPLIGLLISLGTGAHAGNGIPLTDGFWLLGDFTQNLPCKGDGSDPTEAKVRVGPDQIVSKVGVCKFLNAKLEGKRLKATMECQFPAGPLVGDVTFTQKTNGIIDFVDRDNNYTAGVRSREDGPRSSSVDITSCVTSKFDGSPPTR